MATIFTRKNGTFQLRIVNKLLPKDLWATFDSYEAAEQYGKQLEGQLAQGIVPAALLEWSKPSQVIWTVQRCIVEYQRHNAVSDSDVRVLDAILPSVATVTTGMLNYDWAEGWIRTMKRTLNRAPLSTTIVALLSSYLTTNRKTIAARDCRLFPFWNGERDQTTLKSLTSDLSADAADFRFHDLRHEATCRLYEKTQLSDGLIAKITGHRNQLYQKEHNHRTRRSLRDRQM